MTEERKSEITKEAQKRIDLWLSNSTFNEMTAHSSFMRFNMSIGLLGGYPFEKREWMNENDFKGFVSNEEFESAEYNSIMSNLYVYVQAKET